MKRKRKKEFLIVTILIIIILLITGNYLYRKKQKERFSEVLSEYQCIFLAMTKSKEGQFKKDVYLKIPYKPVDDQGNSNKYYYETIMKVVSVLVEKNNFRIIDDENKIIIRVRFENGSAKYTINGDNNYYESQKAIHKTKNNTKVSNFKIKSNELSKIIENDWKISGIKEIFGSREKTEDGYDIYEDEGLKTKIVNLNVFNIVFTPKYTGEVFEGINTGIKKDEIIKKLGQPAYESSNGNFLVGYLSDNCYVFFSNGEISIYKIEEFDSNKNESFSRIVSELQNDKDYANFVNKLTDLYPNSVAYKKNENILEIQYPQIGFIVRFKTSGKSGITLYSNYKGKINENTSITDIENGGNLPSNIYYEDNDGIFEYELRRVIK